MTIRDIAIAFGYKIDKNSEKKANDSINALKNTATKVLGAIGIGFSLVNLNAIAEEFNGVNDKIKNATDGLGDQKEIQERILKAANDTKQSYASMADSVSKLAQNRDVFSGVEDAAHFSELVAKNFVAAGKSEGEIASLMNTINTSMSRGEANSRLMLQLFRDAPETVNMLAKTLGVSTARLEEMAGKGQISAKMLKDAFVKNADAINSKFDGLDYSISDALLNIRNRWGLFVDGFNSSFGITQKIAKFMVKGFTEFINVLKKAQTWVERFTKKIGGVNNLLKLIAGIAGGIFFALNAGKILGFLQGVTKLLNPMSVKIALIAAVFALLFLAVDDFINFMKGNNSFIGEMFKKAGINADEVRDKVIGAWTRIKTFLIDAWGKIKETAVRIWDELKSFWTEHGDSVKTFLRNSWEKIKSILTRIWTSIKKIAISVFDRLSEFWDEWGATILSVLDEIWNLIKTLFENSLDSIVTAFELFAALFSGDWEEAWEKAKEIASDIWDNITAVFTTAKDTIVGVFDNLYDVLGPFAAVIGGITAAIIAYEAVVTIISAAQKIWIAITEGVTAVQWLLNAAMSANPIGIVIALIAGLVAAFIILWNKSEGFRNFFINAWDSIKSAFGKVADFFKDKIDAIIKFFQPLLDVFSAIGDFVGGGLKKLGDIAGEIGGNISSFFGGDKKDDKPKKGGGSKTPAYARGTDNAENTAIVGEEGPELVTGIKGAKVFTSDKTKEIVDMLSKFASLSNPVKNKAAKENIIQTSTSHVETKTITINQDIENNFNGDRAGQEKSAVAMDRATKDSIGELARAMQY